jgi:hypothetical protein
VFGGGVLLGPSSLEDDIMELYGGGRRVFMFCKGLVEKENSEEFDDGDTPDGPGSG